MQLKYGGFHLKLYSIFQNLSWHSIKTHGVWLICDAAEIHLIRTWIDLIICFTLHNSLILFRTQDMLILKLQLILALA